MPGQGENSFSCDTSESDEGIDRSFFESVSSTERTKIFNDNIHAQLELPSICARVINTPQFQRLRNLKQLGLCYHVYQSASHNRFEHCVGTSFLAGKYAKILRRKQPELRITEEDVTCLYLAGLFHDIGHGPFSHTWERLIHDLGNKDYSHEEMSLRLIDDLIEKNDLLNDFKAENLSKKDIVFIKELIIGTPLPGNDKFEGREPSKHFLYQIVSNERTKIDVDKFDYLLRDCKQLKVETVFDYQRLMDNSRVVALPTEDGRFRELGEDDSVPTIIVYRKKIESTLEDLFRSRFSLHQKAYQHRVTKVVEEMVLDGLKAAEHHFVVPGGNGSTYKLSTAFQDIDAFVKLTDSIFERIQLWGDGGQEAAKIFDNVMHRNLYTFLGGFSGSVEGRLLDDLGQKDSNLRFITTVINYGSGKQNPLNNVLFFEKSRPNKLISKSFQERPEERRTFIVYGRTGDEFQKEDEAISNNNDVYITFDVRLKTAKNEVSHLVVQSIYRIRRLLLLLLAIFCRDHYLY